MREGESVAPRIQTCLKPWCIFSLTSARSCNQPFELTPWVFSTRTGTRLEINQLLFMQYLTAGVVSKALLREEQLDLLLNAKLQRPTK